MATSMRDLSVFRNEEQVSRLPGSSAPPPAGSHNFNELILLYLTHQGAVVVAVVAAVVAVVVYPGNCSFLRCRFR